MNKPTISVNGQTLRIVNAFTYLRSIVIDYAGMDLKIQTRRGKASSAFESLYHRLLSNCVVSLKVKTDNFKSGVLNSFFYGAESNVLYYKHIKEFLYFTWNVYPDIRNKEESQNQVRKYPQELQHFWYGNIPS